MRYPKLKLTLSLYCLLLLTKSAYADIIFDFSGNNATQTQAKAILTLKDSYLFGSDITPLNFISLRYQSKLQSFTISPLEFDHVYAGLNVDGSLSNDSGNYQFYLSTTSGKFIGTRTDSTWTAESSPKREDGVFAKWTLRFASLKSACIAHDNFHKAAAQGNNDYLGACLKAGIAINRQEANGWTALHSATQNNQLKTVQFLLQHGANPALQDKRHYTALDLAERNHNNDIAFLLKKMMAK